MRKQRKTYEEGRAKREKVKQRNMTDIIKHQSLASVESLTSFICSSLFTLTVFLSLLSSHVKTLFVATVF